MTEWTLIRPEHLDPVFLRWYTWGEFVAFICLVMAPFVVLSIATIYKPKRSALEASLGRLGKWKGLFQKFAIICRAAHKNQPMWRNWFILFTWLLLIPYLILHALVIAFPMVWLVNDGRSFQQLGADELDNLLRFLRWWFIAGNCFFALSWVAVFSYLTAGVEWILNESRRLNVLTETRSGPTPTLTLTTYRNGIQIDTHDFNPGFSRQQRLDVLVRGNIYIGPPRLQSSQELDRPALSLIYRRRERAWSFRKGDVSVEVKFGNEVVTRRTRLLKGGQPHVFSWSAPASVNESTEQPHCECEVYIR